MNRYTIRTRIRTYEKNGEHLKQPEILIGDILRVRLYNDAIEIGEIEEFIHTDTDIGVRIGMSHTIPWDDLLALIRIAAESEDVKIMDSDALAIERLLDDVGGEQ